MVTLNMYIKKSVYNKGWTCMLTWHLRKVQMLHNWKDPEDNYFKQNVRAHLG